MTAHYTVWQWIQTVFLLFIVKEQHLLLAKSTDSQINDAIDSSMGDKVDFVSINSPVGLYVTDRGEQQEEDIIWILYSVIFFFIFLITFT